MIFSSGLLFVTIVITKSFAQDPIANLPQGRVVGIQVFTKSSLLPVEIYYGIPYATPPVGRFRFSAPERHPGWKRTFYAHRMPPQCPQVVRTDDTASNNVNEDCLFINIWTPRRADGKVLPVVVILYSETWNEGGASLPYEELAAEGIVVVTVSYRLHILGFFTLKSSLARGNLALLDQYLALLWVRENIAIFGGDPAAITLLGHSAGADSVLHQIASPRSTGLFKRAIIMSPFQIWNALDEKRGKSSFETEKVSREIAMSFGCFGNNNEEILSCLRTKAVTDITKIVSNTSWSKFMQPVCDDFLPESQQYLPNSISAAISTSKQPIIQLDLLVGTTDLESINYKDKKFQDHLKRSSSHLKDYANSVLIPNLLERLSLDQSQTLSVLRQAIMWEYWRVKNKKSTESIENLSRMESSAVWGAGAALLAARLARRVSRLYVYRYSQPYGNDLRGELSNFSGAVHGADLGALLGDAFLLQVARREATPQEKKISTKFRNYIVNFIKFGSPSSDEEWQQYRAGDAHVHDIHTEDLYAGRTATEDIAFWLQYLPNLSNSIKLPENSEQLISDHDESRLRGGVFALCGVAVLLLILLLACAILLRKQHSRRLEIIDVHN